MKYLLILTIVCLASVCLAQQVYIVKDQPTGDRIRLTIQDSTGKATDGGEFIKIGKYAQLEQALMRISQQMDAQTLANLGLLRPDLAAKLADTSYVIVPKKDLIRSKK